MQAEPLQVKPGREPEPHGGLQGKPYDSAEHNLKAPDLSQHLETKFQKAPSPWSHLTLSFHQ